MIADDLVAAALALARRFAAGATLWTVAPQWPAHGRHVAVEFVHPVVIGKRALPTIHVDEHDPATALRTLHRPGDIVLVIGPADDERLATLVRRAPAWGVVSLWIGAGPRPPAGAADHVLWLDGADDPADPQVAAASGGFVLLYHLLWELTHVVLEHPAVLECTHSAVPGAGDVCVTCADEGRLAEIQHPVDATTAMVLADGQHESVDVTLVGPVDAGDLVIVHAGSAIARLGDSDG